MLTIPLWQICLDKKNVIKTALELQIIHYILNIGATFVCVFVMPHYLIYVPAAIIYIYFICGGLNFAALIAWWSGILLHLSFSSVDLARQKKNPHFDLENRPANNDNG